MVTLARINIAAYLTSTDSLDELFAIFKKGNESCLDSVTKNAVYFGEFSECVKVFLNV